MGEPFRPQLRPLSIGEILDTGFKLLRGRFGTLFACVLVPVVPLTILGTVLAAAIDPDRYDVNSAASGTSGSADLANLVDNVLGGCAAAIAIAACFQVVSSAYLGERVDAGTSLRYGLSRLWPLLVAYFVISIAVGLGLIALVIPGVFLAVKWSITFPVIVAERTGAFDGMARSWQLTLGHWWRVFGALIVVLLISFVLVFVVLIAFGAAFASSDSISETTFAVAITAVSIAALAVVYPLTAAIVTVLYYDLRVRNEGLDLPALAGTLDAPFALAPERPGFPSPPAD